ncbi:hypothetical protein VN12_08040 [Pirellula sp. SH-Sr6A]|uniref:DUF1592 domain-containing protein n=1 Tax=Pirellula sp. SH-Sr6A TaxID=1632865 RepID=UPI00078B3F83|nr:DUF1592 domain-containing protein [Pirellula sp. SH-Sr6A]AMV32058.1 hypothetical protein VN12_08040 [Pirellula sp. SH-Sr6A]
MKCLPIHCFPPAHREENCNHAIEQVRFSFVESIDIRARLVVFAWQSLSILIAATLYCSLFTTTIFAQLPNAAAVLTESQRDSFGKQIQPLLIKLCGDCHGQKPTDNDLDLTSFDSAADIVAKPRVLGDVAERLRIADMPPEDAPQPTEAEHELLQNWIRSALDAEASARSGDPGPVTLRRLSNTEYDNAIRDLTGVDMRPTQVREFPADSVGGEGFANVGDAMPVTPELVERYHQTARDVASRVVLLPQGFRFSPSADRPDWVEESLRPLREFHARYAGPHGEPPLAAHLAATLKHRERIIREGPAAIVSIAAEEKLNPTYLSVLWNGLTSTSGSSPEVDELTRLWREKADQFEIENARRQSLLKSAREKIHSQWTTAKRTLAASKVAEGSSVSFEQSVSVHRGELLVLTVFPNESHGADSTLVDWIIREANGEQRTWSVRDLVPHLLTGNPSNDQRGASWSFFETTSTPVFLTDRRDNNGGRPELQSWSLGAEPSVFVNSADNPVNVWTSLPARSFFVHPGPNRPVTVSWTSPFDGELHISGRVADVHPSGSDGVSFELSHAASAELGKALLDLGNVPSAPLDPGLPPDVLAMVRAKWREASTDPIPVLAQIQAMQDQLFEGRYGKNAALAVGNGFRAWEELRRVVDVERVQGAAREPLFRIIALPAQSETYVIWDRLRLEGGDGEPLVFSEHPVLRAAIEQASGLRFGKHPQGRPVPDTALVTAAGAEIVIDLRSLPEAVLNSLVLPRFLRADVRLDEASPETASVCAFLIAATGGGGNLAEPVAIASVDDPHAAQILHPRMASKRAEPAKEFRRLFPPAVLFQPIIPRDAQGSIFLYRREDEALQRLMLDEDGKKEIDRLWRELEFVSEQALHTPAAYEGLVQYYRKPNDGARIMFFYIQEFQKQIKREASDFLATQVAAERSHLESLFAFAERAWRRPLEANERDAILASYHADREEGAKHDPALRAALARVLSSPWFLYRVEQPSLGAGWQAISGHELATRLSFLLWDSIPDEELRAKSTSLHQRDVMEQQLRRMLQDDRVRGMAAEFGGRWLGVRDFVDNHGRSLKHFPEFTPALRDALAEEPVQFFIDLLMNDRPVADVIDADAVVINDVLASHYGIPGVEGSQWRRVEDVSVYGRGGFLGFGAVIAKQSAAARTSPIKRGAWIVQMLGERLPKVPPEVPPLPETPPAGLSVREITELHRQDAKCAGCHVRIDPYGMAMERFDAIGRFRPASELKPGDTVGMLRDGTVIDGIDGLRGYFAGPRREDLLRTLARKLTGYALGRAVMTSDRALVENVTRTMTHGGRWSDTLLVIAQSEQFLSMRSVANAESTQ